MYSMEKKMFKTQPFVSEKVWGYERWIVSTLEVGQSRVDDSVPKLGGMMLGNIVGNNYLLLVKVIQANDTLSVQVHPDDAYASIYEHTTGKTECWYVLDAVPDAHIIYGLKRNYSRFELQDAITENALESFLRSVPVSKGDFIFIPSGTVHAIQGGLRLLEVQQPCDVTYRLYDWGRPRELHIQKGLDVIRYLPDEMLEPEHPFRGSASCPYFKLQKHDFEVSGTISFSQFGTPAAKQGWCSLFVIAGSGLLDIGGEPALPITAEDCVMVRRDLSVRVIPDSEDMLSIMAMG